MKACYAEQMRNIDRLAVEDGSIPSIILMENAALACVDALNEKFEDLSQKSIAVFCGKGNNGGDGFAIARHLYNHGINVTVFLVCGDEFCGDASVNFDIIEKMGIRIEHIYDADILDYVIPSFDIVVDAIFGTGIKGELTGISCDTIEKINLFSKYILSVDIPSGMNCDTGEICGVCVKADMTVTFAAYKIGMFLYPAADYTGEIKVKDIAIPSYIINKAPVAAEVIDDKFFAGNFPKRQNDSHKGDYGKILVIGGSTGLSGAVYMAGTAALNCGAGLVTLAVPESLNSILEAKTTEVMTVPMKEHNGCFSGLCVHELIKRAEQSDIVLIGPGMGRSEDCKLILERILSNSKNTVVVDADALNLLSEDMRILENCTCPLIFTPHEMEMSRLTGLDIEYIRANRISVSKAFCEKYGVTLILKGNHTVVTAPDGLQYINNTGNAGLAKGGSGDVLAGIVAAFAARGMEEPLAAAMAVYLHGKSADAVKEENGIEAVNATKVIEALGKTIDNINNKYYR